MDTWIECEWFKCRKRFGPSKRSNRFYRADGPQHEGARFCSPACKQAAYRLRSRTVTKSRECTDPLRTVTHPEQHTENTCEILTKNEHPRPAKVIAGPVEKYSDRSLRAAALPLDPATAEYQRRANDPDTIRRETAWGRKQIVDDRTQPDGSPSDWRPRLPSDYGTLPYLPIPDFLMRTA